MPLVETSAGDLSPKVTQHPSCLIPWQAVSGLVPPHLDIAIYLSNSCRNNTKVKCHTLFQILCLPEGKAFSIQEEERMEKLP